MRFAKELVTKLSEAEKELINVLKKCDRGEIELPPASLAYLRMALVRLEVGKVLSEVYDILRKTRIADVDFRPCIYQKLAELQLFSAKTVPYDELETVVSAAAILCIAEEGSKEYVTTSKRVADALKILGEKVVKSKWFRKNFPFFYEEVYNKLYSYEALPEEFK